jgi:TolB-like protein/tetratricopeptide (TPR) repeat protein
VTLAAGTRLGPYEILSPLGAGGMGEVYRARDSKLERDVAVKVLPESVAVDPDALARFEREAKAVAALSHPNILAIHDFGSHEGMAYAVTELLEGQTLRERLRSGPVTQTQAVDYGVQIAKGLAAAHERGVVHRDLKPENLFVSRDGHLKILDFGLAKRQGKVAPGEETSAPTASGHTETGIVMGTVGYMSPEQVRGLPVDHRTDIFSFGAILYEMLSGQRAFKRDTAFDTMAAITREEPPELASSGVSPSLDHVVKHCLEKDRDIRFQTARDVTFALSEASSQAVTAVPAARTASSRWKAAVAAAVVVVSAAAGVLLWRRTKPPPPVSSGIKRIAVLPFENLGSPEDDYFADGMADAVRGKLTSLPGIEVIARGSSVPYKKTAKSPSQIARELEVQYLLTATVRWEKGSGSSRVEVSPELVEVRASGAPASKWQQPFDASLADVFQVQSDIATRVAQSLGGALREGEEKRLAETPTANLAAYDVFLRAGKETGKRRLEMFEQAVALDPTFAQAWAGVSEMCSRLFDASPRPELANRARFSAEKAVNLAPERSDGYQALGEYQGFVLGEWKRALELYSKGLSIAPGSADLHFDRAWAELSLGNWEQSVAHLRDAERFDPESMLIKLSLGRGLLLLRRYAEARSTLNEGLALDPANLHAIRLKSMSFLLDEGDLTKARAVIQEGEKHVDPAAIVKHFATVLDLVWVLDENDQDLLLRLPPTAWANRDDWAISLTRAAALRGDMGKTLEYARETRRILEEQIRTSPRHANSHVYLGLAFAYLGRTEDAKREVKAAIEMVPLTRDAFGGAYVRYLAASIYGVVGEPEKAVEQLDHLLKMPYFLSPAWLRVDSYFDPLRKDPRFQKLVARK